MVKHLNVRIFGSVHAVFFRATAKELADKLDIKGFARNEPDGSVYIAAEGEEEKLDEFIKWCHKGPSLAQVEKVEVVENNIQNFSQFEIF